MGRPSLTLESYQARLDFRWPARFRALEYKGYSVPARVACRNCAEVFEQPPDKVIRRGNCPSCGKKSGQHRTDTSLAKAEAAAESAGLVLEHRVPRANREYDYHFTCPKHGRFSAKRTGANAKCPKCHKPEYFAPTHPESVPKRLRGKACVLYLINIRDCAGVWTKVGISTNWEARQRHMKKDGLEILSTARMYKTNLYEASKLEWEMKRWMRRVLGRRSCPRRKWSGWSESAKDPFGKFPKEFDRAVREHKNP